MRPHVRLVPKNRFNAYFDVPEHFQNLYNRDDFVIHFPGDRRRERKLCGVAVYATARQKYFSLQLLADKRRNDLPLDEDGRFVGRSVTQLDVFPEPSEWCPTLSKMCVWGEDEEKLCSRTMDRLKMF